MGFDHVGQVLPQGPVGGVVGGCAEQVDEVIGSCFGEGLDPSGPGAVQGAVDLAEGAAELDAAGLGLGQHLAAMLLMLDQLREPLFQIALRGDGLLEPLLLSVHFLAGVGDGLVVSASPPPPGGLLGDRLGVGQAPFGFSLLHGGEGQLSSGLRPFRLPVDGDGGVEVVEVAGHGSAGVAEPVDAVGQGVIGSDTGGDDLSPVVIEAVLQVDDFGSPPTVDALEALVEGLLSA